MSSHLGQHAIVIGGSIAGLTTARVLADHFGQVTVIERDQIERQPAVHKSIPQGNHLHALLLGGQQVLSSLYSGFTGELEKLGAVRFQFGNEIAFFLPEGKAYSLTGSVKEPRALGLYGYSQSRALLEYCVRQCTLAVANVKFESGIPVQGLIYDGTRVRGVRCNHPDGSKSLEADLVVDAGGRGSHAPRWLAESGFEAPEETAIGVDFAYTSAKFRRPAYRAEPEPVILFGGRPPHGSNAAALAEIEDDSWIVSLAGRFGKYPPSDEAGFFTFAKSLPRLYDLIRDAERISDILHFRFPTSVQRHYERLAAFPERFLVVGDAISSFNPVYGQGMSSAALQVRALQQVLDERKAKVGAQALDGLASAFFPKAADVIATPWILAASFDFAYPQTKGERPPNMMEGIRYFAALDALVAEDIGVQRTVAEVLGLAKPLSALFEDPLRSRVLARQMRHAAP
jgi:2-polyprenyl-6-methoxyphenol hydroxylase-like FAD-dependent oxidoreductase